MIGRRVGGRGGSMRRFGPLVAAQVATSVAVTLNQGRGTTRDDGHDGGDRRSDGGPSGGGDW